MAHHDIIDNRQEKLGEPINRVGPGTRYGTRPGARPIHRHERGDSEGRARAETHSTRRCRNCFAARSGRPCGSDRRAREGAVWDVRGEG